MSNGPSQPDAKEEARRALHTLSRDEQRALMKELELEETASILVIPLLGRLRIGADIDLQYQMMFLVVVVLFVVLLFSLYIYMTHLDSPQADHLLSLTTTIVGFLAGMLTPKPVKPSPKENKE